MHTVLHDLSIITGNRYYRDLVLRLLTHFSLPHPQKKAFELPFLVPLDTKGTEVASTADKVYLTKQFSPQKGLVSPMRPKPSNWIDSCGVDGRVCYINVSFHGSTEGSPPVPHSLRAPLSEERALNPGQKGLSSQESGKLPSRGVRVVWMLSVDVHTMQPS